MITAVQKVIKKSACYRCNSQPSSEAFSTTLATKDLTKAAIAEGGTAVANMGTSTYAPDYTKSYYIKSYSSYHKMYVYSPVTNIYSESRRKPESLKSTKLRRLLKKSGKYFYALL